MGSDQLKPHPKAKLVTKEFEQYRKRVDPGEDFPTVIADMIGDLLHLGDAMAAAATEEGEEWDPNEAVDRAMGHYVAERDGDDIELSSRESGYYSDLPLILAMDDDYCPKSADNTHQFGEDRSCDLCGANEEAP